MVREGFYLRLFLLPVVWNVSLQAGAFVAIFITENKGLTHRERRAEGKMEPGSPVLSEAATSCLNCLTSDFIII